MVITTKFDYGDDCWIMHTNRPMKARIFGIQFADVTNKFDTHSLNISYIVRVADSIGGFDDKHIKLPGEYVFKTKYELLNSFR